MELRTAVAALRTKHIACKTFRMNAAQNVFAVTDVTFYQSYMMLSGNIIYITVNIKFPKLSRKLCLCFLNNVLVVNATVVLKIFDCNELHIVFFCKFPKAWSLHHCSVIFHDFAADTTFFKTGKTAQINCCFCVTVTNKNAAFFCNQWEHMSRSSKVL